MADNSKTQAASISAIAKHFNVNISTVSRALSGSSRISREKRDMIRKYAESVNYRPKPMRRAKTQAIGLMIYGDEAGKMDDYHQRELLGQASAQLSAKGYHLHLETLARDAGQWPAFISECRVDGVIVSGHPPVGICEKLREENVPAVIFSDTLERTGCFCVRPDPVKGIRDAVARLVELGHKDVALVSSSTQFPTVEQRYKAFCFAMFDASLYPTPEWTIIDMEPNSRGGRIGVQKILDSGNEPTAIIFINDQMALGGMLELLSRGYNLPDDISIVGFDNTPICEEVEPAMTSVDIGFDTLVADAIELLEVQMKDGFDTPVEKVLQTQLVERASITTAKGSAKSQELRAKRGERRG